MTAPKSFAEERDFAAETYVSAKHAKEQRHYLEPEKYGPLPPILNEQGYMFQAGADWALESELIKFMAKSLKWYMQHDPVRVNADAFKALKDYEAARSEHAK